MTAIVFDMDGTLTDSEHVWDVVRRDLAAAEGTAWPEEATRAMMGMSTQEWSAYLSDVVGLSGTAEDAARRTIDGMVQAYATGIDTLPGAEAAVRRMHDHWPVAIASSSPRVLIETGVKQLGLSGLFSSLLSTEELSAGKPSPEVYLESCRRLGVDPSRSVAVEDSDAGIRSAHSAGLVVIAVPPHFNPPPAETLALADAVLESLDDLSVDLVEGMLAKRGPTV